MKVSFLLYLTSCSALNSDHVPVLIGTACCPSFQHRRDRPQLRHTAWANVQTNLHYLVPFDSELHNRMRIDTYIQNFCTFLKALTAFDPKHHPRDDPRPLITAGIQNELNPKTRLCRHWQITRNPALRVEVNRLQWSGTCRLNEWRNDQTTRISRSRGPVDVEEFDAGDRSLYSIFHLDTGGNRSLTL